MDAWTKSTQGREARRHDAFPGSSFDSAMATDAMTLDASYCDAMLAAAASAARELRREPDPAD